MTIKDEDIYLDDHEDNKRWTRTNKKRLNLEIKSATTSPFVMMKINNDLSSSEKENKELIKTFYKCDECCKNMNEENKILIDELIQINHTMINNLGFEQPVWERVRTNLTKINNKLKESKMLKLTYFVINTVNYS